MKFNRLPFLMLFLPVLFSCSQTIGFGSSGSDKLDIAEQTNDVARSNLNLGIAYMRRGEYEKALEKLKKAQEADPRYTPTLNALGLLYQRIGKEEDAEDYFRKALGYRPNDPYTLNNYGQFLCANKRYDEAEEAFIKSANNPLYDSPEISLTNAGTCALQNNSPEKGENYLRQALEKNPKVPVALIQMSQISYDQGNYLSARGYLQRYLEIAEHTASSLWLGIQIEQQLGDKNTVSSYVLLLKNNFPNSKEADQLRNSGIK